MGASGSVLLVAKQVVFLKGCQWFCTASGETSGLFYIGANGSVLLVVKQVVSFIWVPMVLYC